jgi:hypothetical protein
MYEKTNLIGAIATCALFILYIVMMILRLLDQVDLGHRLASLQFLLVIPLVYLLLNAKDLNRPVLYYIQIILMLVFLIVEFLLDYYPKIEFRQVTWMAISYVTFFCAATGGLVGVAATAGRTWTFPAGILYLIMVILAFVQRAVTGM